MGLIRRTNGTLLNGANADSLHRHAGLPLATHPRTTQYVDAPAGDDANDGSFASPVATVAQAVTNSSAGERIVVLPGTYTEQVDASGVSDLEIVICPGAKLTYADDHTLSLGDYAHLHGRGIVDNTKLVSSKAAVYANAATGICIQNITLTAVANPIFLNGVTGARVMNNVLIGAEGGVTAQTSTGVVVEGNRIDLSGWDSCNVGGIQSASGGVLLSRHNTVIAHGEAGTEGSQAAALVALFGGSIHDIGSYLYADTTNGKYAHTVWGYLDTYPGHILLERSIVESAGESDGGEDDACDLYADGGTICEIGASYSTTSGDVTSLDTRNPFVRFTSITDVGGNEGTVACQVVDPVTGDNLARRYTIRLWAGDTDDYLPDLQDAFLASSVNTTDGGQVGTLASGTHIIGITNASGALTVNVAIGGGGDMYVWAELLGKVYASGVVTIA